MTCMEKQGFPRARLVPIFPSDQAPRANTGISPRDPPRAPRGLAQSWRAAQGDLTTRVFEATSPVFAGGTVSRRGKVANERANMDRMTTVGVDMAPVLNGYGETASPSQGQAGRGKSARGPRQGAAGNHGRHGLRCPVPVHRAELCMAGTRAWMHITVWERQRWGYAAPYWR